MTHKIDETETRLFNIGGLLVEVTTETEGWEDPGRTSGDPEDCYPPEGESEVKHVRVRIKGEDGGAWQDATPWMEHGKRALEGDFSDHRDISPFTALVGIAIQALCWDLTGGNHALTYAVREIK
jgi:hypothetical protein